MWKYFLPENAQVLCFEKSIEEFDRTYESDDSNSTQEANSQNVKIVYNYGNGRQTTLQLQSKEGRAIQIYDDLAENVTLGKVVSLPHEGEVTFDLTTHLISPKISPEKLHFFR